MGQREPVAGTGSDAEGTDRPILVVDDANRPIGEALRGEVHRARLIHRAIHCLVHDGRGRVYLSQRDDIVCRDRYDISLTEHLRAGEDYAMATERGLARRLGLAAAHAEPFSEIFRDYDVHAAEAEGDEALTDDRYMQIFVAQHAGPVRFDRRVYKGGEWRSLAEVDRLVSEDPERFTPHFRKDWARIRDRLDALVGSPRP